MLISSFLPARFAPWAAYLSDFTITILKPLSSPINAAGSSLRHHAQTPIISEDVDQLNRELHNKEREIQNLNRYIRQLKSSLEAANFISSRDPNKEFTYTAASITGRSADPTSPVLHLNVGAKQFVKPDDVVIASPYLVGRIKKVGPNNSTFQPFTARKNLITAVVTPNQLEFKDGFRCQFTSDGSGILYADIDRKYTVKQGYLVRLDDPANFPSVVQGLIVGQVTNVIQLEDAPLKQKIIMQPMVSIRTLGNVTVLTRPPADAKDGDQQ